MTLIWFSDDDRREMREEREAMVEHDTLFFEFLRDTHRYRDADRSREVTYEFLEKIDRLNIRPWHEQE